MNHQDLVVIEVHPFYRDSVAPGMLLALVAEIERRLAAGIPFGCSTRVETCGGGRDECLAEVELWLSSRGVRAE
ncbi:MULTISPECIES: hypothetical protein [unclassified Variovorax]|uniref:hypothetical protein n=1 Tax=unclassified Variovorax TaxID=663243 RepID=UPI0013187303|nr:MULTISPECIES: hypothetical protein [unclassified Variovorax]VTU41911.1 hypothetical protein SRS16P1_00154 [Variovorax sp. SRS16]VTU41939.1 hypothetical protein E5P1_00152 [Variovorax sp. PBL-E5]VTU44519.1 hypothetical protein H6P1_00780 [Variovorax sp. PBL-H6]